MGRVQVNENEVTFGRESLSYWIQSEIEGHDPVIIATAIVSTSEATSSRIFPFIIHDE